MRRSLLSLSLLVLPMCIARPADGPAKSVEPPPAPLEDRLLFPHNFVRGHLDFQVAPPHNEIELGMCVADGRLAPGSATRCGAYARYVWSGYIEFQPIGRGLLKRFFLFIEPKFFGGDNLPQTRYTAAPSLIIWEKVIGGAFELPRGFEVRLTHHRTHLMGRYTEKPSPITAMPDGPYGLNTTVGVRWYFGGYGRGGYRER